MSCLKCISKGLEADSSFTRLWLLYLPLYRRHTSTKGDPSDATHVAESCLSHSKHCYQLWLTAIQLQPAWQQRAILLQRGILALSQTKPGQYGGVSKHEENGWGVMRSACVLDLALRLLLLLWTSAEAHDQVASWIQELVKAATQAAPAVQTQDGKYCVDYHAAVSPHQLHSAVSAISPVPVRYTCLLPSRAWQVRQPFVPLLNLHAYFPVKSMASMPAHAAFASAMASDILLYALPCKVQCMGVLSSCP